VFLVVMIVIIFLSFSALFGYMYMETKLMRMQMIRVYQELSPYQQINTINDSDVSDPETISEAINVEDWQSFSKYGFDVKFPVKWTYRDNPYAHQVDFFSDGIVRGLESSQSGDFNIKMTDKDSMFESGEIGELFYIAGQPARKYILQSMIGASPGEVYSIPTPTGYFELTFLNPAPLPDATSISDEVRNKILENFSLVQ